MAKCSDKKNPLQRNGTARSERLLPAMQNGYVLADEKTFADWIVFARDFAKYLHFYDLTNTPNGDWAAFFSNDVSAALGNIAVQDVDVYKRSIKERFDFLKNDGHAADLDDAKQKLNDLFSMLFSFCEALDESYRLLPADLNFKTSIANIIKINLAPSLNRLIQYYKAADDAGYLISGNFANLKVLGIPVHDSKLVINENGLGNLWWKQPAAPLPPITSWKDYYSSIAKDDSIYGNAVLDIYFNSLYIANPDYTPAQWLEYMKLNHAANHNLFSSVFDQFLMAYSKLVQDAEKALLQSLENNNTHAAHYALFLAFLRLFRFAQNDINTLTQRHLDFYYKEILQLKQRPALPNSAHVIAELAKPVNDFILEDESFFKAGKDSAGKEVVYALKDETTFNKAVVTSLRSVYIGTAADKHKLGNTNVDVNNTGRLFAAPVINSADGAGAELTSPHKEWHPLVNRIYSDGNLVDIQMPNAEIGFAVASHYLYLQEGTRKIMLRLVTTNNSVLTGKNYAIYLTTEKKWYKLTGTLTVLESGNFNKETESCVEFSFTLNGDEPAITNYNAAIHGGTLNVTVPVLKVILVNDDGSPYQYPALRDVVINKFEVAVEVGLVTGYNQQGIKQLQVSTDAGPVDASKPFQPFGGQPKRDAVMVIGNKEVFSKKNAAVKLNVQWGGIADFATSNISYASGDTVPDVAVDFLQDGIWTNHTANTAIFDTSKSQVEVLKTYAMLPANGVVNFSEPYSAYNAASKDGFMRLVLNSSFAHKEYLLALSIYLINKANKVADTANPKPTEPYVPVIQSMYLSYSAFSDVVNVNDNTATNFESKASAYFHCCPFGDAEQHHYLNKETKQYLLPQFRHKGADDKEVLHEGEFYIGFDNLGPKQSVSVLFQVMDGTADPTISKPPAHIHWSYLSNNQWKKFDDQAISDATMQLIQSGIIHFIIPPDATVKNSILPTGHLWIKASVSEKSDAVCKLLSVQAQAAVVSFHDNNNAADFLNTALPAATINKLKNPQSAIKKITQPYSSFGGRLTETNEAFYVRVSERLRHKARAITIWDYEHLILEAFPQIHKVKCLNHTLSTDTSYNEVMPGHVTIITLPDLKQRNDVNPLKPFTSQAVLQSIDQFLRKKISCHVQLHVVNPAFEEVQLKFELQLAKGFDDFTIYSNKLRDEITAFLSPWAYGGTEINFGGKIYKSVLINFIEERVYVDFITEFSMVHFAADGKTITVDSDEINASTAKSILVSKPAAAHEIKPANPAKSILDNECGCGKKVTA